jgi:hypothetical protein
MLAVVHSTGENPGMSWVGYRLRAELRARWRSLLALALFVGVVGGVVLAAAAGARRTATAVDRLSDAGLDPHAFVDARGSDETKWNAMADLPSVEVAAQVAFTYVFAPDAYFPVLTALDDQTGRTVARGVLVAGRRPDPARAHEMAMSEAAAEALDIQAGDTFEFVSYTPAGAEILDGDEGSDTEPDGEPVRMRVTGIVRSPQDLAAREGDPTIIVFPKAFYDEYRGRIGMVEGNFLMRFRNGTSDAEQFNTELNELFGDGPAPGIDAGAQVAQLLEESTNVQAVGLAAFAAVFLLFGLVAVAQAVTRSVHGAAADHTALAATGVTRRGRLVDAAGSTGLAVAIGCVVAVVVSIAASPLLPVGLAGRAEPDPGLHVDPGILVPLAAGLLLVLLLATVLSAWRLSRRRVLGESPLPVAARPSIADRLARAGRPAMAVGVGMAARKGRGAGEVAVRTAVVGLLLGTAGLAAAVVFSGSLQKLLDTPSRYGWTWDVAASTDDYSALAARDDVAAVGEAIFNQTVTVGNRSVYAWGLDSKKGTIPPPIVRGREPRSENEVALGAGLRRRLGDPERVVVEAEDHRATFRVVGTSLSPTVDDAIPLDQGVFLTVEGLARLGLDDPSVDSSGYRQAVVLFEPGVDVAKAAATIDIQEQNDRAVTAPQAPPEVSKLDQVRGLPRVLALFLAGLAVLAVLNALVQTVQRRRTELGVLRAMGFTRGQVAGTIGWQAAALALVGAGLGLPAGVALGRWVWSAVAEGLGVASQPEVAMILLAVGPAAVAMAALTGVVLGGLSGRRPAAVALRTE